MPDIFAKDTARAILNFYTLEDAKLVINRSQDATHSISTPKHNELIVGHLAVLPDFHRRGVGSALLTFAAETARQQNKSHLSLDVDKDNHSAIAFYRRWGFNHVLSQSDESAFLHFQKPV
jgi:ribosomal protein S18 acetylase RimI-like enzyme